MGRNARRCAERGKAMMKPEALELLMLLSALESWSFSAKTNLPYYLHDQLCKSVKALTADVLGEQGETP